MKRFWAFLSLASVAVLLCACRAPKITAPPNTAPTVIVIGIDGFRWDYLEKYDAPVLKQLARQGVHATRMTPSFPSKTFPNHYTLVTGLRPQNHGIVANWFYDPTLDRLFGMKDTAPEWWNRGEPIWITAEKQGVRSACFFWPGSETELQSLRPSYWKAFDKKLTPIERVDGLLAWFALPPDQRPHFATVYFDHVDTAGHDFGPDTPETAAAVKLADDAIAHLLAGLEKLGLREDVNLLFVADHGMASCSYDQVIFLDDLMDLRTVRVESTGPNGGVRPIDGTDPRVLAERIRAKAPPQLQVFLREDVPAHLHYNHGDRIPPVVLLADLHWTIEERTGWAHRRLTYPKGTHGWDPALADMGALFVAHGPAFRERVTLADVDNVDVYTLLCQLLHITPAANDGSDTLARAALRR
jgi:predicted AlkP superfamily pyrophosphatase or phosphodiesterase